MGALFAISPVRRLVRRSLGEGGSFSEGGILGTRYPVPNLKGKI
ncbi:MAG: hypothetical protein P9L88_06855 [Candidatus Tantalella remota]|nr:hypothetical protein [Candidatus Tantalella remota]